MPIHGAGGQVIQWTMEERTDWKTWLLPLLTEDEHDVFRRGRNANVHTVPAHASRSEYQQATALEALLGWLWLGGRHERLAELFDAMMGEDA